MKTTRILIAMVAVVFIIIAWSNKVLSEEKLITLPVGTIAEKLGAGHFKFRLPDGRTAVVKGLQKSRGDTAIIGVCEIYDKTGKLIASGKGGSLKGSPKPVERKVDQLKSNRGFLKIDDDIAWLPVTLTFQGIAVIDPEPPHRTLDQTKTKGLSPQPDPPGKR